ncbi:MAG: hypothetical protein QNJ12_08135, partial [Ilumatobacter sp.]|uniref:hypothetical protein n=1 Tax=Ilumatobacter sp. TaxID=1967498 RepID=UPI00261DB779
MNRARARRRSIRASRLGAALVILASTAVTIAPAADPVEARTARAFGIRFQTDTNGAIDIFGNTLLTCPGSCATVQNPTGTNSRYNNQFDMTPVDADSDPSTSNSSSATVSYPAGATLLFAGLYWGAQSNSGQRNRLDLRVPGAASYTTVTASQLDNFGQDYQAFADITSVVAAAGPGEYFGANIRANENRNDYAGWAIVVAYEDPALPLRNLTVFDGYGLVANRSADRILDIPLSGFLSPPTGPVNAELGVIAYEGDGGIRGDQFLLDGNVLSNGQNPSDDFFNSTVSTDGSNDGGRNPDYQNTLGFDADEVDVSGIIPNAATSATLRLTTTGDAYFPGMVSTQIDLFAPQFPTITKTVVDVNGGTAQVGDVLHYSVSMTNVGLDPALDARISDVIPTNTTYVPESMLVNGSPVGDSGSDGDAGEFDGTRVSAFVGTGATSTGGGTIGPNESAQLEFDVTIDIAAAGTDVTNVAQFDYVAQTLGQPFTFTTNSVVTPVDPLADLAISKVAFPEPFIAGAAAGYTLTVTNNGPNPADNVSVADVLPAEFAGATVTPSQGSCTGSLNCTIGTLGVGASATVDVSVTLASGTDPALVINNTATVTGSVTDLDTSNNASTVSTAVDAEADLRISKSAGPVTATAGEPLTYTVTVVNDGPSDADAVQVAEILPPELLSPVLTPSAGGACTGTTCTFAGLAPGANATVTVSGTVSTSASGTLTNAATASAATPDPDPGDNTAVLDSPVVQSADLSVTKTASPSPAVAGELVTYTVTVANAGPSDATNVALADTLPALTGVTVTSNAGTCTGTSSVSCDLGTIADGGQVVVTVTGTVPADQTADLTNVASVSSDAPDPVAGNDSTSLDTPVVAVADLRIEKTVAPNPIVIGSPVTYTITVTNDGPSDAASATVADTLPGDLAGVTVSSSQGGCAAFPCDLGPIAAGASATITVGATATGTDTDNTATVSSTTTDPDGSDNSATVTTTVTSIADLRVDKATDVTPVAAGESASWTITVTNDGPSPAGPFDVVDILDPAFTPTSATIDAAACVIAGQTVTCSSAGLAVGASATLAITADVDPSTPAGTIANTASISGATTPDPAVSNDSASSDLEITTSADLSASKTVDTDPITPGLPATFTVTASNAGPSDGDAVVAADVLPPGWTLDAATDPRCSLISGVVDCDFGVLAAGGSTSATIVVVPPPNTTGGAFTNTVTVSSNTLDPDPADNAGTAGATITPVADISVTKVESLDPAVAGEAIGYTIEVSNAGPSDARTVTLADADLAGLEGVTMTPAQGTCDTVAFTCDLGTITPGSVVAVTVTGTVPSSATPGTDVLTNTVTVASPADTTPANNTATELTSIVRSADLALAKSTDVATAVAGDPVTWTIAVTNQGPSAAANVSISDTLPAGLVLGGATTSIDAGSCSLAGPALSCSVPTLAAGATATATVTAQVDPAFAGTTLDNSASATSDDPDDNLADNVQAVSLPVVSRADLTITKNPSNPTPVAGESVTWVVQVANAGPSSALSVEVDDVLPAGFAPTGPPVTTTGACDATVNCVLGTLAVGALVTITIEGTLGTDALGVLTNTATVTSTTTDPAPGDNTATADVDVRGLADLSITKVGDLVEFTAGSPASWTITVDNTGPSDAENVAVADTLPPAGFAGATLVPSQGACTGASCDLGTIAAGGSATISVSGTISAAFTGADITNAASVSTTTPDPDGSNDATSSTVPVAPVADLSITKRAIGEPFVPGAPVTWEIVVTNNGPSDTADATVTDTLPAGALITSATAAPSGTCTGTGTSSLSCDLGPLAAGAVVTVTVAADLPAGVAAGTLTNTATVSSTTADPDGTNDSSTDVADVVPEADLQLAKAFTTINAVAGQQVLWDVTVVNAGPSDARNVVVTDPLPPGLTLAFFPPGCTGTTTITCSLGDLPDGATVTLNFVGDLSPDARGVLSNTATVAGDTADPDGSNDSATATRTIDVTSDVTIVKTAPSPVPVPGGAPGRWTITLTNNGPSTANGVTVDDPITGVVNVALGAAGSSGACSTAVVCTIGDLPPGASVTVLIDVAYPADATPGTVSNTATVSASTPLTGTLSSTDSFALAASADLVITKVLPGDPITAGTAGSYVIDVVNQGPSDASGVLVTDVLPPQATSPVAPAGCSIATGTLTCSVATLASGAAVQYTVDFVADPATVAGDLDNTATVTATSADPDGTNNSASITTGVVAVADLVVSKGLNSGPSPAIAGSATPFVFEATVDNNGPSAAANVVLTDVVPAGFTLNAASVTGTGELAGACSASGATITCSVASLLATGGVTYEATLDPDTPAGPLTNTATVTSTTTDPAPDNNSDDHITDVERATAVTFTKTSTTPNPLAGTTASWQVTGTVAGPSTAEASTFSDTLPVGFTPTSVTATVDAAPVACTVAGRLISCPLGELAPGANLLVSITADIDPALASGGYDNAANFSTITPGGSSSSTATTTLGRQADLTTSKVPVGVGPFVAGQPLAWTITVTNNGPSTSENVTVTEAPSGDYLVDGLSASQGSCTAVSCDLGTLLVGDSATITVRGSVDPAAPAGTVGNVAFVGSDTPGATPPAIGSAPTIREVSLRVTKTAAPVVATAGSALTWTVTVVNDGPSTAENVTVDDVVPAELVSQVVTPSVGTWAAPTWTVGTLLVGQVATLTIDGTLIPAYDLPDTSNTATVATSDPNVGDTAATVTTPVLRSADVAVDKRTITSPVVAGAPVTWEIDVTNNGPSDATDVVVTDVVPSFMEPDTATFTVAPPTAATCDAATGVCDFGTITAGTPTTTITVTADLAADTEAGLDLVNTATATTTTPDPDGSNDTATTTDPVTTVADLVIAKVAVTDPLVAGAPATWRITVTNNGPSDAQDLTITDTPTGVLAGASASSGGAACTGLTCTLASLGAGEQVVVDVTGTLAAGIPDGTDVTNTAEVTSPTDPNSGTKTASVTAPVSRRADLRVEKVVTTPPVAGEPVVWTVTVTNDGPSDALPVTLTDVLPPEVTNASLVPSQGTCPGDASPCDLGIITAGAAVTVTVTADVPSGVADGTTITNSASASSVTTDPDGSNDTGSVDATVVAEVDLSIDKVVLTPVVVAGEPVSWSVTLTNNGPSDVQSPLITDFLPADVSFVGLAPCAESTPGQVLCPLSPIVAGGSDTVTVVGVVDAAVPDGTVLTNTAFASSEILDSDLSDNSDSVDSPVTTSADLAVAKVLDTSPVVAGEDVTWTVTVTNNGPSDAQNVSVADTLPANVTFVSTAGCAEDPDGSPICSLGTIAAGASASYTITGLLAADAADGSTIANSAAVSSDTADPTPGNDSVTTPDAPVTTSADLAVAKVLDTSPVVAGENVTWTVTVTNNGPSDAQNVSVADTLPANVTFVSTAGCAEDPAGNPTCSLGTIAAGATASYAITGLLAVDAVDGSTISNQATVASSTADPDGFNNTVSSAPAPVTTSADLGVAKVLDTSPVVAGEDVTWTVTVTNNGPSDAQNVRVADTLPANVTFVLTAGCVEDPAGNPTCSLGTIAAGASASYTITGLLAADAADGSTIANTAVVSSDTADPDGFNNTISSAPAPVTTSADLGVAKVLDTDPVVAGENVTWTVTVTNNGPSDAQNVTVTDTLPANVTFVSTAGCAEDP